MEEKRQKAGRKTRKYAEVCKNVLRTANNKFALPRKKFHFRKGIFKNTDL
jgi:hypothetical protein